MSTPNYAFLPSPSGLQFSQWAAVAAEQLASYGVPAPPTDDSLWKEWASFFVDGSIPGTAVPSPHGFNDWQTWASILIGTLA
jgi:hypothetical protein